MCRAPAAFGRKSRGLLKAVPRVTTVPEASRVLSTIFLLPTPPRPWFSFSISNTSLLVEKVEVASFQAVQATADEEEEESGQAYTAIVRAHRDVEESGLQHAFIQICPVDIGAKSLKIAGSLDFKNPYGYLPGADFGCLPFELFRVLASVALGAGFGYAMWRHRASVLTVHKMILGVIVLATLEACTWWGAYSYMNRTGKPYCCPYPGTVVLAMVMEVLRRTTSRFMLLMICLGYGITRMQLERREMISVVALTVAFCASGILQLASSVASASNVGNGDAYENYNPLLAVPALLFDMVSGKMWVLYPQRGTLFSR